MFHYVRRGCVHRRGVRWTGHAPVPWRHALSMSCSTQTRAPKARGWKVRVYCYFLAFFLFLFFFLSFGEETFFCSFSLTAERECPLLTKEKASIHIADQVWNRRTTTGTKKSVVKAEWLWVDVFNIREPDQACG